MTNKEQKLWEIIEKYDKMPYSDISGCFSDLTAIINEHYYPKEFTERVAKMIDMGDLWESQMEEGWILYPDPKYDRKRFGNMDELFNYWKENESSQKTE